MQLAGASADEVLQAIPSELLQSPERGAVVPGLGGMRKACTADPTRRKGKRGGLRYLYLYLEHRGHIHLLFLLAKNEQEDATPGQKADLRRMVTEIKKL